MVSVKERISRFRWWPRPGHLGSTLPKACKKRQLTMQKKILRPEGLRVMAELLAFALFCRAKSQIKLEIRVILAKLYWAPAWQVYWL